MRQRAALSRKIWWRPTAVALLLAACGGGGGSGDSGAPPASPAPARWSVVQMPASLGAGIRLFPAADPGASDWCLYRGWPEERLHVIRDCGGAAPVEVVYAPAATGELLSRQAWAVDDALIVAVYDAARNIPSGRMPGKLLDGIDLIRFDRAGQPTVLGQLLPLGGLDTLLHGGRTDAGFTACGGQRCFAFDGKATKEFGAPGLSGYEIVEAVFQPWGVDALVRSLDDGSTGAVPDTFSFAWARIDANGARIGKSVPRDCVPHALTSTATDASWSCAQTPAQLAALLRSDLQRMPHQGLIEFGASNAEGRIAWSQVYYLEGLMHVTSGRLAQLAAAADWHDVEQRVRAELSLIASRADDGLSGFRAKRYSVNRTPLLFGLHLGRIARLLDTAQRMGYDPETGPVARQRIGERLQTLAGTVEQPFQVIEGETRFDALRFTPGIDFWCDGANVPHNYTSAYVHGLLATSGTLASGRSAALLSPLLALEAVGSGQTWHYWWNLGFWGWAQGSGVSTNMPTYDGQKGLADISYRSIDAMALLMMESIQPGSVAATTVQHLRALVAQGSLLPFVNEVASQLPGGAVALQRTAAYRHARSAAAWEIESQVWALEALAAGVQ